MKTVFFLLSLICLCVGCQSQSPPIASPSTNEDTGGYVITGDLAAVYQNGDVVIWTPKSAEGKDQKSGGTAAATSMASASPAGKGSNDNSLEDSLNVLAKCKLENGHFRIEGELDRVQQVYFYVLNAVSESGHRMGPVKGQSFILEPGEMTMTMNDRAEFSVRGGKYNDAVFNVWKLSSDYQSTKTKIKQLYEEVANESEQEKRTRLDKASSAQNVLFDLETEGRKKTAMTHPDVLARKLAIETAWLGGPWMLKAAYEIQKMAPEDEWVNDFIFKQEAHNAKRKLNEEIGRVGGKVRDFEAKTLGGEVVSFKEVRGKNKFVLLEFWASWCGPCRAEIPHLKKAYAKYSDQGFEILSFTIDDDRDAWATASEKEELPWLDTGFGDQGEAKKLYEVTGVPANYLVNGTTGEVIARNLRGHKLDEKLQELLD